jgi:hypothetical protein
MVGLLGRVISPSQGLYLHRTTQHRNTRTNIHAQNTGYYMKYCNVLNNKCSPELYITETEI